jgi:hypothetical protein
MNEIETFVLRKLVVSGVLLVGYIFLDRVLYRRFNTAEVIQHDPKAVAILLGCWALAIAQA